MIFHLVSIFPKMFDSYLNESIIARALKSKKIKVKFYNPRDFTRDRHRKTDFRPYGGGPGMALAAEPILRAVARIKKSPTKNNQPKIIIFSPGGKLFTNQTAAKLAKRQQDLILIAGRYEGIDARVKKILKAEEYSIGPYIVTGGELPAMVFMDAVARQIPGVLGKEESLEENRISSHQVYTRPRVLIWARKKYKVPLVLLSGHHKKITEYRRQR